MDQDDWGGLVVLYDSGVEGGVIVETERRRRKEEEGGREGGRDGLCRLCVRDEIRWVWFGYRVWGGRRELGGREKEREGERRERDASSALSFFLLPVLFSQIAEVIPRSKSKFNNISR